MCGEQKKREGVKEVWRMSIGEMMQPGMLQNALEVAQAVLP